MKLHRQIYGNHQSVKRHSSMPPRCERACPLTNWREISGSDSRRRWIASQSPRCDLYHKQRDWRWLHVYTFHVSGHTVTWSKVTTNDKFSRRIKPISTNCERCTTHLLTRSIIRPIFICRVVPAYHCPLQDICSHLPSIFSLSFLFLSLAHRFHLFMLQNMLCTPYYSLHCPMWGWYSRSEGGGE